MDLSEALPTPISEAAFESQLDDLIDSNSFSELETPQILADDTQEVEPATSEQPAPNDEDFVLTGKLENDQRREVKSKFVGDMDIVFDTDTENINAHRWLPKSFYRTFYETSATLSRYVTVDTHVKHRERKSLRIREGNAFQPVANFSIDPCMLLQGIERHLVWNQKRVPSAYISVFDMLGYAKRRAMFHYETSQRIGQRVSIARIHTKDLVPATIKATCEFTVTVITKHLLEDSAKTKQFAEQVDIPVWIHKKARDQYGSTITPKQLKESGSDMWMSINELLHSKLISAGPRIHKTRNVVRAKGHKHEWLCCGAISDSRITGVWPWDGKKLYFTDPGRPVRSFENSGQPWVWNWGKKMWLPDTFSALTTLSRVDESSNKRNRIDDAASQDNDNIVCSRGTQTYHLLSMSTIHSIEIEPIYPAFLRES